MNPTPQLPEILRKLRVVGSHSQDEVAKKLGVSLSTYSRIERGEVDIDFDTVRKAANFYKITLDQLVHYGDANYVAEPTPDYNRLKLPIMVLLDGTENTLQVWIDRLKSINTAI
ncbi:MAG: helix-turn-helix domain-containing protein [Flammeovirgaceae bacterium]|jgi:transcriptional regulator with XRE-family HTH domain|nr:helix-turn-helix domain-containing protein [Flammeovirgaceae bacterium]